MLPACCFSSYKNRHAVALKPAVKANNTESAPMKKTTDFTIAGVSVALGESKKIEMPIGRLYTDNIVSMPRSEEHTSELQSRPHLVCRLLLEKKNSRFAN